MDKERPHLGVLDRDLHEGHAREHFSAQLNVLEEVVNYGTNLVISAFTSSPKDLTEIVLMPILQKQVVSMLDGLEVLVSKGCGPVAQLQSRAMFEASVYMDFIMQSEAEKKSIYYYVAVLRRELTWSLRLQDTTPESSNFAASLGEFADTLLRTKEAAADPAARKAESIRALFTKEPWSSANADFDTRRGRQKHDPPWHAPWGRQSVRSVSEAVGRLHEYEVFYSGASEKMHSSEYKSHITMGNGTVTFEPIRSLEGLHVTLHWAMSTAFHSYGKILERYRPGQLQEFKRRYTDNWRETYLNMPRIRYEST